MNALTDQIKNKHDEVVAQLARNGAELSLLQDQHSGLKVSYKELIDATKVAKFTNVTLRPVQALRNQADEMKLQHDHARQRIGVFEAELSRAVQQLQAVTNKCEGAVCFLGCF